MSVNVAANSDVYIGQATANALFAGQNYCVNLFLCFLTLSASYYIKDYQLWQISQSSGFYSPKSFLLALRSKPILLLWILTTIFSASWSALAALIWPNRMYTTYTSEPRVNTIKGSYDQDNVIVLPPYYIQDVVAYGYNTTCKAFATCFNSTLEQPGLYPLQAIQNLSTTSIETLYRQDRGFVTDFNISERVLMPVGGKEHNRSCMAGRPFCTAFMNSSAGKNMVLANDLRLDVNRIRIFNTVELKNYYLAGSINWPNIYETFTTGNMSTTYAAVAVYNAGVNNSVQLSEIVVYIQQNYINYTWTGDISSIIQAFNHKTTLCDNEPNCTLKMTAINGSARLARVSIVNNVFRLESINIYTSEANITSVASVNLTFTGYIANLGDVYDGRKLPINPHNSLVFSNTSKGDTRPDTRILKQMSIDTVFYTGYGWSGKTLSSYARVEYGVKVNTSMIIVTVLAVALAISTLLMYRYEGLRAFEPPLALTIAKFVEHDKANAISPDSAGNVQLRPSASRSNLFLTVNGKTLMTTDATLSERLSLVGTTLDGEEKDIN
jgi:hypothetical protein